MSFPAAMIFVSHLVVTDLLPWGPKSSSIQVTTYYDFFFSINYTVGTFSLSFDSGRIYVGENKIAHFLIISYGDRQKIMCQIFVAPK